MASFTELEVTMHSTHRIGALLHQPRAEGSRHPSGLCLSKSRCTIGFLKASGAEW
jgi:hypothetical protein